MPGKLPKGWVETTLGGVCGRVATIRPEDSPDIEFTYFDIGGIDNQSNRIVQTKTFVGREAPSRARKSVRKDDILFSTVRTYLKKIARIEQDYPNPVASTGFAVIRPAEGVLPNFLFSQVLSEDFLQPLHKLQSGSSYPAVRDKDVFAQLIWLAPTREQERMVAKLDTLLSQVAAGEAAARRELDRLHRYRIAVLHAAVTGELTRDSRETHKSEETGAQLLKRLLAERRALWEEAELKYLYAAGKAPKDKWKARYRDPEPLEVGALPDLPSRWTYTTVEQVGLVQLGRQRAPKHHSGEFMRPYLRVANVFDDRIDLSDIKQMNFTPEEFEVYRLERNDILLNEGQSLELVGRAAMFRDEIAGACFQNTLVRFRPVKQLKPLFALIVFRAYMWLGRFQKIAKWTTNIAHLGADRFARLEFPLPPLAEQSEIIRQVEHRLSAAKRLAITLKHQLERAKTTRQSLLREAFSGSLVAQDANDEPASVLLERLRAAREAEANKPKAKHMSKSKSKPARRKLLDVLREHKKPITAETLFRESGYEALLNESDEPQDVVDSFYSELRQLTANPAKVAQHKDSKNQVLLRAIS